MDSFTAVKFLHTFDTTKKLAISSLLSEYVCSPTRRQGRN